MNVARAAVLVGACVLLSGCQASGLSALVTDGSLLRPAAEPATAKEIAGATLAPRMTVIWSVQAADGHPAAEMRGEAVVGPNGAIELGPYGSVTVAGLSLQEARCSIEAHLGSLLKQPKVTLELAANNSPVHDSTPVITVGQITAAPAEETAPMPRAVAPEAPADQTTAAAPQPSPLSGTPVGTPAGEPAAASPEGRWQALAPPAGFVPTTESASTWRAMPGAAAADGVTSAGWRARTVAIAAPEAAPAAQPEPGPTELKVYPRRVPDDAAGNPAVGEGLPPVAFGHGPGAPHEQARVTLPPYVIDPPDVLLVESTSKLPEQPIRGQHLVRPDGTIGLGIYGSVYVAGMTLDQAREAIAAQLSVLLKGFDARQLSVDVLSYNSKFYYIVSDGGGYGEQVIRLPITGNETVLDAISQIGGLGVVASKKQIWVARTAGGHGQQILPVDWCAITKGGQVATNYQIMPNDRIYVNSKGLVRVDTGLARVLSPVERVFGITLLGSTTVNSIRNRGLNGTNP
jgi:polysaccharide export outer membrane protein